MVIPTQLSKNGPIWVTFFFQPIKWADFENSAKMERLKVTESVLKEQLIISRIPTILYSILKVYNPLVSCT